MHRPLRDREALISLEVDRAGGLGVHVHLAVEDEKELVLLVVLMPRRFALEYPESNDRIVFTVVSVWLNQGWCERTSAGMSISVRYPYLFSSSLV